ncbi:MAG: hypothetical protein Fur0037_28220 [Planctomycetota bacterium]
MPVRSLTVDARKLSPGDADARMAAARSAYSAVWFRIIRESSGRKESSRRSERSPRRELEVRIGSGNCGGAVRPEAWGVALTARRLAAPAGERTGRNGSPILTW